uniref:Uncharacterized protein n=1 Tax=uncultured nuHF2 cluster bacterium HF0770_42C12 TaxID=723593 RepID=E7C807_9BACT|nr:hypothetical protein [uncultured nuHF2 cluster bacterium HF0770_42C12]
MFFKRKKSNLAIPIRPPGNVIYDRETKTWVKGPWFTEQDYIENYGVLRLTLVGIYFLTMLVWADSMGQFFVDIGWVQPDDNEHMHDTAAHSGYRFFISSVLCLMVNWVVLWKIALGQGRDR